ncbi:MAG: Double zinc ribbon [Chthonomonadaceae bacterium]|nr:Double zinc ribbon [Chthonomonadaceae bacterium]
MPERLRTVRHKMLGMSYDVSQRTGRAFAPCPDCQEQIPKNAKRCRYCGWQGGYRSIVRPTLRHFLLRLVNLNLSRSSETIPCPHCQWAMPATAKRCPLCLRSPEVVTLEPSRPVQAWMHLRRQWVKRVARNAVVCPQCSVQVPPWAPGCLCCGWERPRAAGKVAMMGYALAEVKGEVLDRIRPSVEPPPGDICPECDILVPRSDRRCMICGWVPDRKKTIRDAAGYLLDEIKQRGAIEDMPDLNLCKGCHVPMPPNARMCLVCGWAPPVKNPILRYLRKKKVRSFRKHGPSWRPCPSCRLPLTRHSVKCMACGWEQKPIRYWGKTPRGIWATMAFVAVASYFAFQYFVVLAAGGSFGQDQYGRNRFERNSTIRVPVAAPSPLSPRP